MNCQTFSQNPGTQGKKPPHHHYHYFSVMLFSATVQTFSDNYFEVLFVCSYLFHSVIGLSHILNCCLQRDQSIQKV